MRIKLRRYIYIDMERIPGFMASIYNKAARTAITGYYGQVADEIVAEVQSGVVLDLGTGPGYLPIEIAKRVHNIQVIGIDLTPGLIRIAQENSAKAGIGDRVQFEIMDAADLQFEDNTFDMIFSTGMLHSLRSPEKVERIIKECYRVLKPGGKTWIYDPAKIRSGIDVKSWKALLTFQERFLEKIYAFCKLLNPPHYYGQSEIVRIVARTDFKLYSVEEKDGEIRIKLKKTYL